MTEYWLLWFENIRNSEKASELTKSFVENKNSLAYKTLKRTSGWGCFFDKRENGTTFENKRNEFEFKRNAEF